MLYSNIGYTASFRLATHNLVRVAGKTLYFELKKESVWNHKVVYLV